MDNNIIPTVALLVFKDEQVLLVRHGAAAEHLTGEYGFPAGRVNKGESEKEAARRELKEETGLDTDLGNLILLPKEWQAEIEMKDGAGRFSMKVFMSDRFFGQLSGGSEAVPEWVNIGDLKKYTLLPNVENAIKEGLMVLRDKKF